jgi:hypothetical protein
MSTCPFECDHNDHVCQAAAIDYVGHLNQTPDCINWDINQSRLGPYEPLTSDYFYCNTKVTLEAKDAFYPYYTCKLACGGF